MRNNRVVQKKGFSFLSFFLGILIGIILIIGAVGGAVAFVLYTDLDTVFNTVKLENKDEDGNYIYINTDTENGGAKTVLDLAKKVMDWSSNFNEMSVAQVEDLIPATSKLVDSVLGMLDEYVHIERDDIVAVKFSEFGQFVQDTVMDIQPATLLEKFDMTNFDGPVGELLDAVIYGKEAAYVTVDGVLYPVWFEQPEAAFIPEEDPNLYYYEKDGEHFVVEKTEDGYRATDDPFTPDTEKEAQLTGKYYEINDEKTIVTPVTLRDLTSSDGLSGALDDMIIIELLGISEDDKMVNAVLGGVSVGDVMNGKVNFTEKIQGVEVTDLLDIDPENSIMAYLGYGLTGVTAVDGQSYAYTAKAEGETVYITAQDKKITGVYSDAALTVSVKGTTVNGISDRIDGIDLSLFMDVKPDDAIMMYLGYGVTDAVPATGEGYSYQGLYEVEPGVTVTCYITVDGDKVDTVYYKDNGENVFIPATGIDDVGDRIGGITDALTLASVMDVDPDNAIMSFLGFGLTKVEKNEGTGKYTALYHPAEGDPFEVSLNVDETEGKIVSVYHIVGGKEVYISGTKISKVGDRIDDLQSTLTIGEIIEIDPDDKLMNSIAGSTLGNVSDAVNNTTLDCFITEVGADDNITAYVVYGITEITAQAGTLASATGNISYTHVAKDAGGNVCYITTDDKGNIADVYGENGEKIAYTTVESVGRRISGITDNLRVCDILSEDQIGDNNILKSIRKYKIGELANAINDLTLQELYADSIYSPDNGTTKPEAPTEVVVGKNTSAADFNNNYLYWILNKEGAYELVDIKENEYVDETDGKTYKRLGELTYEQLQAGKGLENSADQMYYSYGRTYGVWKFLLCESKSGATTSSEKERAYALMDMNLLVGNATDNIRNANLGSLQEAGIIRVDAADLEKTLRYDYNPGDGSYKEIQLKNISLQKLIEIVISMAQ